MMRVTVYLLFIFVLPTGLLPLRAQKLWSLTACINHAIEHNIDLNVQKNLLDRQGVNLLESKANLLPNLNFGSGLSFNFGRNIDGNTNAITFDQTISNNYWVGASIDLFKGFVKQRTISFNKYLLAANKAENEVVKNKLIFDIINAYYISLYSVGLTTVAKSQVNLSKMQRERMQKMVDIGRESPLTVQDLKSQWATDKLNLVKAENQEQEKLLELKQLLRLSTNTKFGIDTLHIRPLTVINIPEINEVFFNAEGILPGIKQQEYLLTASERALSIVKGQLAPTLYLSAGWFSNYFNGSELSYFDQIKNNQNQQIRMGLTVPVFNGGFVRSNIQRKKIDLLNQQLLLEKQKDQLYARISKVYNNAKAAQKEYNASTELLKHSQFSLQNVATKLEKGLASTTDYEIAKQRLRSAKVAQLKAKLTYTMYMEMLEYYRTGNWAHLEK